ncbi:7-cyano-7-deazaguanine synthase, partial [Neisseria gonorrhoeae]
MSNFAVRKPPALPKLGFDMSNQKALVIFSGGQDSTTCLIQAIQT